MSWKPKFKSEKTVLNAAEEDKTIELMVNLVT